MQPAIIFFDLDGTLIPFGRTDLSPKLKYTFHALQKQSILLYACTGRPAFLVPDFGFDGMICFNGALALTKDGKILVSHQLNPEQTHRLVQNAQRMNLDFFIASQNGLIGTNEQNPTLQNAKMNGISVSFLSVSSEDTKEVNEPAYSIMLDCPPEQMKRLFDGCPDLHPMIWSPGSMDIVNINADKGKTLLEILNALNIPREKSLAFGDGQNDIPMLKAAGTGVAMANADDSIKKNSDAICLSVDEDGVYEYLLQHGVILPAAV